MLHLLATRPGAGPCLIAAAVLGASGPATAGRPFTTDDAGVVGDATGQVETWLHAEETALQHWIVVAVGPVAPLELSVGGVYGLASIEDSWEAAGSMPVVQAKLLAREPDPGGWPGMAAGAGVRAPFGSDAFAPTATNGYAYLAFTASVLEEDRLLVHLNAGASLLDDDTAARSVGPVAALGAQVAIAGSLAAMGEVFAADPHAGSIAIAGQIGLIVAATEAVQLDATLGTGLSGDPRPGSWGTLGVKLVTPPLWE